MKINIIREEFDFGIIFASENIKTDNGTSSESPKDLI